MSLAEPALGTALRCVRVPETMYMLIYVYDSPPASPVPNPSHQ